MVRYHMPIMKVGNQSKEIHFKFKCTRTFRKNYGKCYGSDVFTVKLDKSNYYNKNQISRTFFVCGRNVNINQQYKR